MTTRRVIVIGAARSGTKILRDALAEATGSGKVPYDIGYVWRLGNEAHPDDVLPQGSTDESSCRFIRRFIDKYAAGQPTAVIEKTVGNTLRVPVVSEVLPDAVYIHLIRNGVDVIESTRRQWTAPPDLKYMVKKARHFPLRLAPRYGVKYLLSLAKRLTSDDGSVGTWGPRYQGIDDELRCEELLAVCARQWRNAVVQARFDLDRLALPTAEVRYEDFVQNPGAELDRLAAFSGLSILPDRLVHVAGGIIPGREGEGMKHLTNYELDLIDREVGDLLADLGYDRPGETEACEEEK